MRTTKKLHPGEARTLVVVGTPSPDFCDVFIAEEGITLQFERQPDGVIRCGGSFRESSDTPERASRSGFVQARQLALREITTCCQAERVRGETHESIVDSSSTTECVLLYLGNRYSYNCDADQPLSWATLRMSGVFRAAGNKVMLAPNEAQKLRARAFTRIKQQRKEEYENDGLGVRKTKTQLELLLTQIATV